MPGVAVERHEQPPREEHLPAAGQLGAGGRRLELPVEPLLAGELRTERDHRLRRRPRRGRPPRRPSCADRCRPRSGSPRAPAARAVAERGHRVGAAGGQDHRAGEGVAPLELRHGTGADAVPGGLRCAVRAQCGGAVRVQCRDRGGRAVAVDRLRRPELQPGRLRDGRRIGRARRRRRARPRPWRGRRPPRRRGPSRRRAGSTSAATVPETPPSSGSRSSGAPEADRRRRAEQHARRGRRREPAPRPGTGRTAPGSSQPPTRPGRGRRARSAECPERSSPPPPPRSAPLRSTAPPGTRSPIRTPTRRRRCSRSWTGPVPVPETGPVAAQRSPSSRHTGDAGHDDGALDLPTLGDGPPDDGPEAMGTGHRSPAASSISVEMTIATAPACSGPPDLRSASQRDGFRRPPEPGSTA